LDVLRDLGAQQMSKSSGFGGSQDVETLSVKIGERVVVVEAETYVGLSISGDPILVHEVALRVRKQLPRLQC
jgi:hypothetical protein